MLISCDIRNYVQNNIVPEYFLFDKAHDLAHVEKVINNSLAIAEGFDVNTDMVYVIAAYHDIGLKNGRENHEKISAKFHLADLELRLC